MSICELDASSENDFFSVKYGIRLIRGLYSYGVYTHTGYIDILREPQRCVRLALCFLDLSLVVIWSREPQIYEAHTDIWVILEMGLLGCGGVHQ